VGHKQEAGVGQTFAGQSGLRMNTRLADRQTTVFEEQCYSYVEQYQRHCTALRVVRSDERYRAQTQAYLNECNAPRKLPILRSS
jgi:hypothetical protein